MTSPTAGRASDTRPDPDRSETPTMTRRRGLSLTEVLVALLTMFPLGALQMGQALKDDRTTQAAVNAKRYMQWYWKHYVVTPPSGSTPDPFAKAMDNPTNDPTTGNPTVLPKGGPPQPW